jgi:hypothetical protein
LLVARAGGVVVGGGTAVTCCVGIDCVAERVAELVWLARTVGVASTFELGASLQLINTIVINNSPNINNCVLLIRYLGFSFIYEGYT